MKMFRNVLWGVVALVFAAGAFVWFNGSLSPPSQESRVSAIGGPFNLVRHDGAPITQADVIGRNHAIFFGFTHCPDVCPTTLFEATAWLNELGEEGEALDVYFFTVDPERDTPEVLGQYVSSFHPNIVGVTGEPENMKQAIKAYKAYAKKVDLGEGDYTMDHSASILLFREDGSFKSTISYGENSDVAVAKLRNLMKDS